MISIRSARARGRIFGPSAVAALLLGSTLAVSPAISAQNTDEGEAVQFTFENLQPDDGFFFTEPWVGLHNGDFDLFDAGERATPGLEALAEGGNTELIGAEFAAQGRLQATIGNGDVQFISPGEVIQGSIDVRNAAAYPFASFASMIIPTNDAFFGNEDASAYRIFDEDGNFTGDVEITIFGRDIYDAGTEVNDGLGAAGFSQGFDGLGSGDSTDDQSGAIALHPGFENLLGLQTAAGTTVASDIAPDEAVARLTISLGDSINTVAAVGPLFEGSVVDDAPAPAPTPAPEAEETFLLLNQNFNRYLEAQSDGNVATATEGSAATQWNRIGTPDGYIFQSVSTGLYLSAGEASEIGRENYNASVTSDTSDNVLWDLIADSDGTYRLNNIATDRLLDADRRNDFNVDTSRQIRPDTSWELVAVDSPAPTPDPAPAPTPDPAPTPAPNPIPTTPPAGGPAVGAVFVGTNDLDENAIAAFSRAADGTLTPVGEFSTGGQGSTEFDGGEGLDPLISADSIIVTEDEQFLLTVNAGSNEVVSFRILDDFSLERISVVDSGGVGPNSVAVDGDLVFVTNIDRDGVAFGDPSVPRAEPNDEGNVVGFTIGANGVLTPTGSSFDLDNRPANIDFSTDGDRLIVSSITSGSAVLPGENAEASVYSFDVLRSGRLQLADTNTPTLRGNSEGRNLPSAIDFDITIRDGREFVVVTEAREFNSEGGPPALPALQAGSVTVYELGDDSSLTITEGDFAFTNGADAAPNAFGADGQQLTACWIDFGHGAGADIFYVANAINSTISSVRIADDGTLEVIEDIAAAGTSGFAEEGVAVDGPTTFGTTDGFIDLDVSPDGNFLYQLEGLSGNIGVYALDGAGGLELVQEFDGGLPDMDTQGLISIGG